MSVIIDPGESGPNRFEMLVQSVSDYAIYMLGVDGTVMSWNAGAQRFKGYTADEILGAHFSRFYTEEDRAAGIPALALRTAAEEGRFKAEGWRVRKDGTRFWASVVIDPIRRADGTLTGFAKITRDLTDRRAAEEALRQSEERFRLFIESVTDYAIYMLDPDGRIASWNAGAQRFKGYAPKEIIGQHFSRFYTEEDRKAGLPRRALDIAAREGRFEAEGWRVRKDGSHFWANVVIDPVRDESGTLIGFAKITRDLTERRQSQFALEQALEAFYQAQKMEAIGKLTGGVAHDFNNLLAAIVGSLDLARRKLAGGADISRFIDNAMAAAERGATLTQRMLAFARKQELKCETIDPVVLVRGMAELLQTIGGGVAIDIRFPLMVPRIFADAAQLELALLNLAVNARDAMPDGGRIVIAAREEQVGAGTVLKPGAYVCLSVTDTGHGMAPEILARATEPFYTTKGVGKGTGLGLSMAQGFAEQCGGKLALRSTVDEGTTAELWLPVSEGAPVPAAKTVDDTEAPPPIDPLVVLAVDDDALVLTNTAAMLEDGGHRVLQAHSGKAALAVLGDTPIDVLVTDFAMPEMSGAQLAQAVRSGWPGLPVLLVSGFAELPAEAADLPILAKPFRQEELLRYVAAGVAASQSRRKAGKRPGRGTPAPSG